MMIRRIYRWLIRGIEWMLIVGILLIVIFTVYEVLVRQVFGKPTLWTNEITTYLLVWLGLMGVIYAYEKGTHVSVDLVFRHLKPFHQRICNVITAALIFLFGLTILVYGYHYWWLGHSKGWKHFGMLDVPTSYTRIAVPLCGLFLVFQVIITLYDQLKILISGEKKDIRH